MPLGYAKILPGAFRPIMLLCSRDPKIQILISMGYFCGCHEGVFSVTKELVQGIPRGGGRGVVLSFRPKCIS